MDWRHWDEYAEGWQVADSLRPEAEKEQIFRINVLGFQTHRDHFAIAYDKTTMAHRVSDMLDNVFRTRASLKSMTFPAIAIGRSRMLESS